MKKLFLLSLSIAATCVASAQTVLESETLPAGHESQVVQDEAGRIYRRLVKPYAGSNETVSPLAKAAKADDAKVEQTFYEGFEGWKESLGYDWIPEGWTEINTPENTPTEEMLLHNINNSWYVYASSDFFQEMTTDGVNEAFIHYAYDNEKYGDWGIANISILNGKYSFDNVYMTPLSLKNYNDEKNKNLIFIQFVSNNKYMNVLFNSGPTEYIIAKYYSNTIIPKSDFEYNIDAPKSGPGQFWHIDNND